MKISRVLIMILFISSLNSVGCNLFSEMSDKTSDEAVADDVVNLIDKHKWNDAILKWNTMSADGQAKRANKVLLASAYAGRGGLDILNVITSMNNNSSGANSAIFSVLMTAFRGKEIHDFDDQIEAERILTNLGVAGQRTIDENILMAFISLAKIGTLMAATADINTDGVVDGTFDNCTNISNVQAAHIVTGLSNLTMSLAAAGTSIAGSSITAITNLCNVVLPGACSITDVSSVNAVEISAGKTMAGENNLNIGLKLRTGAEQYEFIDPCPNCPNGNVAMAPFPLNLCP
jgi:hypothetical protein